MIIHILREMDIHLFNKWTPVTDPPPPPPCWPPFTDKETIVFNFVMKSSKFHTVFYWFRSRCDVLFTSFMHLFCCCKI